MQRAGLAAAMLSTALGGTAIVSTRYLAGTLDPVTTGAVRFFGGFVLLAAVTLARRDAWPQRPDWAATAALGLLFYGLFPVLFNAGLVFTTASRGALALSTTPLFTMVAAAVLGVERPTRGQGLGAAIAIAGVAIALGTSAQHAPPGAWRGDALMLSAACCMGVYNVLCQPFIRRSSPLAFATAGMGIGATCLVAISIAGGGLEQLAALDWDGLVAALYLATVCGALGFYLWAFALGLISPTLVGVSVAINPITATLLALPILGEPLTPNLVVGLVAVLAGITVASRARA